MLDDVTHPRCETEASPRTRVSPSITSQAPNLAPPYVPRSQLEGLVTLTPRLRDLAARGEAQTRWRTDIMSKRQLEDAEVEQNRRLMDQRYQSSLAARAFEDDQSRERRAAEDAEFGRLERGLVTEENAILDLPSNRRLTDRLYRHFGAD